MLKVIIVDDELYFRESLKKMVPWETIGYSVCGEANNGRDALQLIKDKRPDVILLDINMPMIDGLTLAKILREEMIHCTIIIITGYAEFEYVKKAIDLNVFAYLTKPIDEKELVKHLVVIRDTELVDLEEQKEMYAIKKSAKTQMCYQLIKENGFSNEEEIVKALSVNKSDLKGNLYQVVVIGLHTIFEEVWKSDDDTLCFFSIINIINEMQTNYTKELLIMNEEGYIVLLSAYVYSENQFIIELKKVIRRVEEILGFRLYVALGSVENSLMSMNTSFKLGKVIYHNMRLLRKTSFMRFGDSSQETYNMSPLTTEKRWLLASYMKAGQVNNIEKLIGEMFNELKQKNLMYDVYVIYVSELYATYNEYLTNRKKEEPQLSRANFMNEMLLVLNLEEAQDYVIKLLREAIKAEVESELSNYSQSVKNILMIIHEHYQDESLSVQTISDKLFMNYTYICNLFKKELSISMTHYITNYRIERARILFDQGNVIIYAVASSVGYSDANYFGKKFKSIIGLTPSQYVSRRQETKNITTQP